ncbi:gelsolin-like protein 2 [Actinia tenebrosa]|uniref:Gelsolin-like protein 2 n=1 Tax=Actinia tenebrosa TaxID=6105 RepID=A0A6P8I6U1_ACTTE|nr:gelsolin-like protein 2 [Actinia tenebrosa]
MSLESNGVERTDYPWKKCVVEYSSMTIDEEEYRKTAKSDPLWANVKSIKEKHPMIWEVYNSQVTELVKEEEKVWESEETKKKPYCRFYNDRAYIVLCWHKAAITFIHDLHIWVSKHCSSQDYKLATIKAEQLNLFLDEKPILHREIQLEESDTFHTYFKVEVRRKPKDKSEAKTKYDKCCLLQFHEEEAGLKGKKKQWMVERKFLQGNLCSDDVFVIMNEYFMYLWEGKKSIKEEKDAAEEYIRQKERASTLRFKSVVRDSFEDKDHPAYHLFPTKGKTYKATPDNTPKNPIKRLYYLTNNNGKLLNRAIEDTRTICKSNLTSNCIYLLDTESQLYVWIGSEVSYQERCRALFVAENFLMEEYPKDVDGKFHQPINKPITLVNEENPYLFFDRALMR